MGYGLADSGVDIGFISVNEAHALLKADKAFFVDSRNPEEHEVSRIQGSVNIASGVIYFKPEKLNKACTAQVKALAGLGKQIIVYSDNGIPQGGQRSRCMHTGQYLIEVCPLEPEQIVRLEGGMNQWKKEGFDGILGDLREMYAGKVKADPNARVGENSLKNDNEKENGGSQNLAPIAQSITAYRVLKGEVYKKAATDAEKIMKIERPVGAILRTTGQVWTGPSGGRWAELDVDAGEKPGWVYVEGPGFGPSSRHMKFEFLAA